MLRRFADTIMICAPWLMLAPYGCANPGHLYFYQTTIIGVDVAVDSQSRNAKVSFGYDRQTAAVIPMTELDNTAPSGSKEKEAMSVLGTTYVDVHWFGNQSISENLATGTAAQNVAKTSLGIATLFQKPQAAQQKQ